MNISNASKIVFENISFYQLTLPSSNELPPTDYYENKDIMLLKPCESEVKAAVQETTNSTGP